MNTLTAAGGIGGIIALLAAIAVVSRGIFRQVSVTEENTAAVRELSVQMRDLQSQYNNHETRITVLEDRIKR